MAHTCNVCNKQFSTLSNLNYHKKTAKYCLEMQTTIKNTDVDFFTCDYCNKEFTVKSNFTFHLGICKVKKEQDEELKRRSEYENKLKLKEQEICFLKENAEREIRIVKENAEKEIRTVRESSEKEIFFLRERVKELTDKLIDRPTVINNTSNTNTTTNIDNSIKTTYNIQFKKLLDELIPYTTENVKSCMQKINYRDLIDGFHNSSIGDLFKAQMANSLKELVFCTDKARGSLVTKLEDGSPHRVSSSSFILDVLNKCTKETADIAKNTRQFISNRYIGEEFSETMKEWEILYSCITNRKEEAGNFYTDKISKKLITVCPQLTKKETVDRLK